MKHTWTGGPRERSVGRAVPHARSRRMEAFVIHFSGAKHWALYGSLVELPWPHLRPKPAEGQLGAPSATLEMRAGRVLYMPAGLIHEAHTRGLAEPSVHITLGIEVAASLTWAGAVIAVLDRLASVAPARLATAGPWACDAAAAPALEVLIGAVVEASERPELSFLRQSLPMWRGAVLEVAAVVDVMAKLGSSVSPAATAKWLQARRGDAQAGLRGRVLLHTHWVPGCVPAVSDSALRTQLNALTAALDADVWRAVWKDLRADGRRLLHEWHAEHMQHLRGHTERQQRVLKELQ